MASTNAICNLCNQTILELLDFKLLLRYVTGFNQVELITKNEYELSQDELVKLNNLVARRQKGEPLHYILGYKEFYSREFRVTPDTLIPRPETELLVDKVLSIAIPNARLLDLGTGSGCIAVACKLENPNLDVVAVDKYSDTLEVACTNAIQLGAKIKCILSDWFSNVDGLFDVIVSNPPYIAHDDVHLGSLQFEPQHALTDNLDGFSHIKQIIRGSIAHLKKGGYLLFEHGFEQGEMSRKLLHNAGFIDIETIQDYASLDRITLGKYTLRNSNASSI